MAFRSFAFRDAAATKRVADVALMPTVPQPPSVPRKRSRVGSPELNGRRRIVRKTAVGAAAPAVPVKGPDAPWTEGDNEALRAAVMQFGERKRDWPKVGRAMAHLGRDKDACRKQWLRLRPPVKGSWTEEEDRLLATIVAKQGPTGWSGIAKHIAGRNAKQCRERWVNHLNPNVNKQPWTAAEDALLVKAHGELGNKWSEIAKRLKGRPDNAVKNRWYTLKNRANGGGRKRQRARRAPPNLASLLAKAAQVDVSTMDADTKATLSSLADRFSELAQAQAAADGTEHVSDSSASAVSAVAAATAAAAAYVVDAPSDANTADTSQEPAAVPIAHDESGTAPASAGPSMRRYQHAAACSKRRRSFHRRSVLAAAASATAATQAQPSLAGTGATAGAGAMILDTDVVDAAGVAFNIAASCDSLDFSRVSMASDVLRDAAANMSLDLDQSTGLESGSLTSDLLTALDSSLDLALAPGGYRGMAAAALDAAASVPAFHGQCPAPPAEPRRKPCLRRPGMNLRTVTTFPEVLLAPSPTVKPSSLESDYPVPAEVLNTLPLATEATPLDELSLNSLSMSLAELSFHSSPIPNIDASAAVGSSLDSTALSIDKSVPAQVPIVAL